MSKIRIALSLIILLAAGSAFAQASRTWVSGVGDDANPCSRTAPCKTFAGAISKTATDGEISVLDPGGFGAVTITKGMRIDGSSFVSSALVANTNDIIVNTTGRVSLSHLKLNGLTTGLSGVSILSTGSVTINECEIFNFASNGISVTGGAKVQVVNTQIYNVPNGNGILGQAGAQVNILVDNCTIDNTNVGVHTNTNTIANISHTSFSGNTTAIQADASSVVHCHECSIFSNGSGIVSLANTSTIRLYSSMIQQNGAGFNVTAPSNLFSAQNNSIQTTGNTGTLQPIGVQ
jgi:hypothetical protein